MAEITDDDHLFEDMTPESPSNIRRNIIRRLGLASQVSEAIRSPNNNTNEVKNFFYTIFHHRRQRSGKVLTCHKQTSVTIYASS